MTSLAHPQHLRNSASLEAAVDAGVEALEAYHSDLTWEQQQDFVYQAEQRGLMVSGGSDYHGPVSGDWPHEHLKRGASAMARLLAALGVIAG